MQNTQNMQNIQNMHHDKNVYHNKNVDHDHDYDYDYIIFHRGCLDGFAGFFIFIKCLSIQNQIKKFPYIYPDNPDSNDIPPNISDKKVLIIDVAYKKHTLEEIIKKAKHVTHIDHHVTIRNDVIELESLYKDKFISVYDINESGASLTWLYFQDKLECFSESMPNFIKYIRDNDIGTWKLKNTMAFIISLRIHYALEPTYQNVKKWSSLFDKNEVDRLIKKGNVYLRYENYLLLQNFKRYSLENFPSELVYNDHSDFFTKSGQYKVAVICGSGCPSTTILGKYIVDKVNCDFCILWTLNLRKKKIILSFRSRKTDVGKIAHLFGGGGHEFAASCAIPLSKYNITDIFY